MVDDDIEPAALAAAARVDFQLTYGRTMPRRFRPAALDGPDIPCAYGNEIGQSGGWYDPRDDEAHPDRTEDEWVARFAGYAVAEAVHEALEWFRVNRRPWLDPHGKGEDAIHAAVDELVGKLVALRARVVAGEG